MTDKLTEAHVAELKAAAEKATPGPWTPRPFAVDLHHPKLPINKWKLKIQRTQLGSFEERDAKFIALCREAVPALLEERDRLREACKYITPYLKFTISDESPGHHPTMPSAVADFIAKTAPGE